MSNESLAKAREKSEKKRAPIILQVFTVYVLLLYVYDAFYLWEFRKPQFAINAIVLLAWVIWETKNLLVWQDFFIGCVLSYAILFFRLVSYAGMSSFWNNVPYLLVGFSLGLLIRYTQLSRHIFYFYAMGAIAPFLYMFFVQGYTADTGFFLPMNRNVISRLLVFAVSVQMLVDSTYEARYISLLPSVLTVVISFHSESRTGLLVSILLLFIGLMENSGNLWRRMNDNYIYSASKKIILLVGSILVGLLFLLLSFRLVMDSRFAREGFSSSGRIQIYREFLSMLSLKDFLIGFRPDWLSVNLHNTYLTLLSYYGIVAFVFIYWIGLAVVRLAKTSFIHASLLAIFCIYSLPESIAPFSVGTFSLIPLLMIAYPPKRLGNRVFPNTQGKNRPPNVE